MTRKKFVKQLMGLLLDRNAAEDSAAYAVQIGEPYAIALARYKSILAEIMELDRVASVALLTPNEARERLGLDGGGGNE